MTALTLPFALPAVLGRLWRVETLYALVVAAAVVTVFQKGRAWERGVWETEMAAAQEQDAAENKAITAGDARRVTELTRTITDLERERDDLSEKIRRIPATADACLDRPIGAAAVGLRADH